MDNNSTGLYKWSSVAASANGPGCESKLVYSFSLNESELNKNKNNCSWCGSSLLTEHDSKVYRFQHGPPNVTEWQMLSQCNICGWYFHQRNKYSHQVHINYEAAIEISRLKSFDITDEENISIAELGTYLKKHFSDNYMIPWYRFEQLVNDIFKNLGYRTEISQTTSDDGTDIIILNSDDKKQAIIEIKRYEKNREIGIDVVKQLIGSQYLHQVNKSYLVTNTSIAKTAYKIVEDMNTINGGLELELWDSVRLLYALGLYNSDILPAKDLQPGIPLWG